MKKAFAFISLLAVASLIAISCKKSTTTSSSSSTSSTTGTTTGGGLSINSTPQVIYSSSGTNYSYITNSTGTIQSSSSVQNSASSTPGTNGREIFGASIDDGNSITYMSVNWGTLIYPSGYNRPDTATFRTYFTTGAKTYSNSAANGIEITMYDGTTAWSTSLGAQTGSTFNVDAVKQQYLLGASGDQYMKFKASFSCKLYSSGGASKTITNGVFIGYFDNM